MTVTCPRGTANIEQTFNAARTEYQSVMKMKTSDGEMTMTSTGRKVGSCDARQARQRRHPLFAEIYFLWSHGLCHLLGYDHPTARAEKIMDARMARLRLEGRRRGPVRAA